MKYTKLVALALVAMLLVLAVSCEPEAKHVHEKDTHHEALGTCKTAGAPEYWDCKGCDAKLDADCKVLESLSDVLNPNNHEGRMLYTSDRTEHIATCGACGTLVGEWEPHSEEYNVPMGYCSVCNRRNMG